MKYDHHKTRLMVELPLMCYDVSTISINTMEENTIQYSFLRMMLENNMFIEWWYDWWPVLLNAELFTDELSAKVLIDNQKHAELKIMMFKTVARLHICIPEEFRLITYVIVEESSPLHPLHMRDELVTCIRTFCDGDGIRAERKLNELSVSRVISNNWLGNEREKATTIEGFNKLKMIKRTFFDQKASQLEVKKWMETASDAGILSRCKDELKSRGETPPFPEYKR